MIWLVVLALVASAVDAKEGNCSSLLDVIAVVDGSDSLTEDDFSKLKTTLLSIIEVLDLGDGSQRFGVVVFSSSVSDVADLNTDADVLESEIKAFEHPAEGTHTDKGILKMKEMFEKDSRKRVPQVAVVITDGRSKKTQATIDAANETKALGVRIISVGIGLKINEKELEGIASTPDDAKQIKDFDELRGLIPTLVNKFCIVNGGWTNFTLETEGGCSTTCGDGTKTFSYTRTCTNPAPLNGGNQCIGSSTKNETEVCKVIECPVDGGWSSYTNTNGQCSVTCGGGIRTVIKTRTCTSPEPQHGGQPCQGEAEMETTGSCAPNSCPNNPCSRCRYVNGVGYMAYNDDCRYFLQCVNYGASYYVKQCPPNTYWDQKHLTCGHCNKSCKGQVLKPIAYTTPQPEDEAQICDGRTKYVAGNDNAYEENVPVVGWVKRQCPPGTVFSTEVCICVHGGPRLSTGCKAEVYLPFNGNFNDQSGNKYHVQNVMTKVSRGFQAQFDYGSYLHINRFSNSHLGNSFYIDFLMSKGEKSGRDQAIVSNAECGEAGSLYIILRRDGIVEFRAVNSLGKTTVLGVRYTATTGGLTRVSLRINRGKMTATVNGKSESAQFKGNIGKTHCALQIGKATGYDGYRGMLDDFKVFLCSP